MDEPFPEEEMFSKIYEKDRNKAMERWKLFLEGEGASSDFLNGFEFGAIQFEKALKAIQESKNAF